MALGPLAMRSRKNIKASFVCCTPRTYADLDINSNSNLTANKHPSNLIASLEIYVNRSSLPIASSSFYYNLYYLLHFEDIIANLRQLAATSFITGNYESLTSEATSTAYSNVGKICF